MNDLTLGEHPTRLHTLLLILAFTTALVGAGHSVGPVGLLLALGWNEHWVVQVVSGWMGIACLLVGSSWRWSPGTRKRILLTGAGVTAFSWLGFVVGAEARLLTVVFSVHYVIGLLLFARALLFTRTPAATGASS